MTDDQLRRLRMCESGGRYGIRNGSYSGAYQFTHSTWRSMGTGYPTAADAPPAVQDDAARRLYARSGRGQWPHCGRVAGLA
jgi:resuscitation-promoting factor RpfB